MENRLEDRCSGTHSCMTLSLHPARRFALIVLSIGSPKMGAGPCSTTIHSEPSDSPFNTSDADLIYSVNVVNFQSTVFISDFMHMRDKTVCGF